MRGAWRYLVCTAVLAVLVAVYGRAWADGYPPPFPDSSSYLAAAAAGPFSTEFWFGARPPTYPFLIWVIGPSPRAIVVAQVLIAVLAWAWLLVTVWQQIRSRWVAVAAVALLLGIAVQTRWAFWHAAVLTESLSGSLAVAGVAAWWRWFAGPDRFRLVGATAITAAWMLLRDSNAVTLLVAVAPAVVLLGVLERRRTGPRRRGMLVALSAMVVVAGFSLVGQYASDRGETSFHNNVGLRWLPDADMRAWMVDRGMPIDPALEERAGSDAWADGEAFLRSPFLGEYREWAGGRGRAAAAASFVLRADWYLDRLWDDLAVYTRTDHRAYDTFEIADRLPERPLGWLDPIGSRAQLMAWTVLVLAAALVVARRARPLGWLIPFWCVPVLVDLYLTYVADAIEVGRHLVGPMLRWSVVSVVSVALAADVIVSGRRDDDTGDDTGDDTFGGAVDGPVPAEVDVVAG